MTRCTRRRQRRSGTIVRWLRDEQVGLWCPRCSLPSVSREVWGDVRRGGTITRSWVVERCDECLASWIPAT